MGRLCPGLPHPDHPVLPAPRERHRVPEFFTLDAYRAWWDTVEAKQAWDVQYYKGLGTNTRKDAQAMFSKAAEYLVPFEPVTPRELDDLDMCFHKKRVAERKQMLAEPSNGVSQPKTVEKFVRGELVDHFRADNARSIPSLVDGLKPSQRKVLYACLKKNLVSKMVVERLAGYVAQQAGYHHGQKSLEETIVGMAASYVGGLNLPLLVPASMMGTRLEGGKDHASSRYTKTFLQPYVKRLFPQTTNVNLDYLEEEGETIEPVWYFPVVCLALVNGCHGIGTGYSTHVPTHALEDVVAWQRAALTGAPLPEVRPFVKGFRGETRVEGARRVVHTGTFEWVKAGKKARVTELPPGKWTNPYLRAHREKEDRKVQNNGNDEDVDVVITKEGLTEADLGLKSTEDYGNMVLFDAAGCLAKYASPAAILEAYLETGRRVYEKNLRVRRETLAASATALDRKLRFTEHLIAQDSAVIEAAADGGFPKVEAALSPEFPPPYDDLVDREGMVKVGLTDRAIERLRRRREEVEREIEAWKGMTATKMWLDDLDAFEKAVR